MQQGGVCILPILTPKPENEQQVDTITIRNRDDIFTEKMAIASLCVRVCKYVEYKDLAMHNI